MKIMPNILVLFVSLTYAYTDFNLDYEQKYSSLIQIYRCPVCQNQSLMDSTATSAQNLRKQIHSLVYNGSSPQEINDILVSRYGEHISTIPPSDITTFALWKLPFLVLAWAFYVVFKSLYIRDRKRDSLTNR
ncbi:MAG: cytochrome c-type biogenesis protein [Pseudomonadota bacterium]|nr:cytochrome c-type biogenesis protein [Pseudomonadota bacterium]